MGDGLALADVDVGAARQLILVLFTIWCHHQHFAVRLGDIAELDETVDFGDDRGFLRVPRFEELDDARETARDVFLLRGFARVFTNTSPASTVCPS